MEKAIKRWINCYLIDKCFAEMTCPHCRNKVIVPEKDIYNYDYCPRCGKYVGVGNKNEVETGNNNC